MSKECRACHAVKPIEEFHRHPGTADGRLNYCKTCKGARVKGYQRQRYVRLRKQGICVHCAQRPAPPTRVACDHCTGRYRPTTRTPGTGRYAHLMRVRQPDMGRCRCGLSLPCESCLPGIDHYAERRLP